MSYADTATGEVLEVKAIPIGLIDNGPAVRTDLLDDAHAQALFENIDHLPNIKVRIAGDRFELIDGRHRLAAHKFAHRDTITAEVYDLDDREHWLMAVEANTKHGRGLSLTERRRNAQRTIDVAPDLSNREIARRCGLSPMTVGKLRPENAGVQNGHPAPGQNDHADRAGEAESGDASGGSSPRPSSPAQPSSDDGGVSVSESSEPATPADSLPAPSSGNLEDPAGESSTGEDEGTAHDPSSPLLDKLLPDHTAGIDDASFQTELQKAVGQVRKALLTFDTDEVGLRADPENWEQLDLLLKSLGEWFTAVKAARPIGLRVINGEKR